MTHTWFYWLRLVLAASVALALAAGAIWAEAKDKQVLADLLGVPFMFALWLLWLSL